MKELCMSATYLSECAHNNVLQLLKEGGLFRGKK
jgi:hypothetical protein